MNNVSTFGNIEDLVADDDADTPVSPADPASGDALTFLILGSDDRSGENAEIGGEVDGMRSDTTIVAHISSDRSRIEMVSIPRDSMVDIPSCTMTDGTTSAAQFGQFNSAFAIGAVQGGDITSAVACTWKTVQSLTGIQLDGAVVVDFTGFESMVNALGGVEMCIPVQTISPQADLYLEAGWQTLNGQQALGFARARKGEGQNFDGSDTARTGRQQQLMAAVFNQLLSKNFFTSLPQLYAFADAATESLTVSDSLKSPTTLVGLGYSLRGVSAENITFMTIPFEAYPPDPLNRIQWSSEADLIWSNIASDIPALTPADAVIATESSTATPEETSASQETGTTTDPTAQATTGTDAGTDATTPSTEATPSEEPTIKQPVKDPFTAADTTAVC